MAAKLRRIFGPLPDLNWDAIADPKRCGQCGRALADEDELWLKCLRSRRHYFGNGWSGRFEYVCGNCIAKDRDEARKSDEEFYAELGRTLNRQFDDRFKELHPCKRCGRKLHLWLEHLAPDHRVVKKRGYFSNPYHFFSTDACMKAWQSWRASAKRLRARKDTRCQTCGDSFTPPRNDAKYCSSRCRQKAYRQRGKDNVIRSSGVWMKRDERLDS